MRRPSIDLRFQVGAPEGGNSHFVDLQCRTPPPTPAQQNFSPDVIWGFHTEERQNVDVTPGTDGSFFWCSPLGVMLKFDAGVNKSGATLPV